MRSANELMPLPAGCGVRAVRGGDKHGLLRSLHSCAVVFVQDNADEGEMLRRIERLTEERMRQTYPEVYNDPWKYKAKVGPRNCRGGGMSKIARGKRACWGGY